MAASLEQLTTTLLAKAEALGDARSHVEQLADQYPVLKEMAIIRVMERDKISSNAAKDIVKSDPEFMGHRTKQRKAGIALCRAEAEHDVAKLLATQASLITPSTIELQAKIKKLELDLKIQKQERENAELGRAKANRLLAERIDDVRSLTERQRRFWGAVDLIAPRPLEVYDAWENSIARRATAMIGLETAPGAHEMPGDLCATQVAGA